MNYFDFYKHTIALLKEGRLLDALTAIQTEVLNAGADNSAVIVASCAEALNTYRSLLSYFEKGVEDKGRASVYADLTIQAARLNEQLKRARGLKDNQSIYYSKLRGHLRVPHTLKHYLTRIEQQRASMLVGDIFSDGDFADEISDIKINKTNISTLQAALFDYIWIADRFSPEELNMLAHYFGVKGTNGDSINQDSQIHPAPDAEAVWMVSALTLSILFFFDAGKWALLQALAASDNVRIRVRARVGCALVVMNHRELLAVLDEARQLDDEAPVSPTNNLQTTHVDVASQDNCHLQWHFMMEYKTKFVQSSINETLNSLIAHIGKGLTEEQLQNMLDSEDDDLPSGVDASTIRHLREEIMRTTNMTAEGIDTAYRQFRRLRGLPFYNEVSNWLRPIDAADEQDLKSAQNLSPIIINAHICSSDAYAFIQAIGRVPAGMRSFVDNQLKMLGSAGVPLSELMKNRDEDELSISYIRDIYRLFTIKMKDHAEGNPLVACPLMLFVGKIDENNRAPLASLCSQAFSHRLYRHAVHLFGVLEQFSQEHEHTGASFPLQPFNDEEETMYAVSLALTGDNDDAIIHFETAGPDHLNDSAASIYAHCLWSEGLRDDALKVYRKLYVSNWSGLNLFDVGTKLFGMARYTEASTVLYKAHYLDATRAEVVHLLMLSLLRDRRPDEALAICAKLVDMDLTGEADMPLWLKDAALCQLCAGNQKEAIACLRRAHSRFTDDDIIFLSSFGIPHNIIRLIEDAANI